MGPVRREGNSFEFFFFRFANGMERKTDVSKRKKNYVLSVVHSISFHQSSHIVTREKQLNVIIFLLVKHRLLLSMAAFFKQLSQSDVLNVWLQMVKNINF